MDISSQSAYAVSLPAYLEELEGSFAPARPLYFTYIPAILIFGGALSWIISGSEGLVLGSAVAAAVALFTLWEWLFRRAPTRFSTLLGMALLLGYGVGALNTWFTLPRSSLTLGEIMGLGQGALARGIAAVLFSAALLYLLGEIFEKPLFAQNFRLEITETTRSLIYGGAIAMLIGYARHSLVLGGTSAVAGHISILGVFLAWLYTPLTALAVAAFLMASNGRQRLTTGIAALGLLLMSAVLGRRSAIYTTVEILFVLALAGYRWRGKSFRNTVIVAILGGFVVVSALVFMLLRIAPAYSAHFDQTSISQRAEAANRFMQQGDALAVAARATQHNLQTRTFVLAFLANILDASTTRTPAMGIDALSLLESTIPSVIDPGKGRSFSEEALDDKQFGFSYGDQANSVLTAGATDFSLLGMLLYPLVIVALARLIYAIASRVLKPLPVMIVALGFIHLFMQTEVTLSGYFAGFRNAILFGLVIQLFLVMPRFRLTTTEGKA